MTASGAAVEAEGLSKRYRLRGHSDRQYRTLRDALARALRRSAVQEPQEERDLWALRDVSFAVEEGEVLGIVGRNGAGKSTLLKVLSRITEPTSGRARLRGRVASLLEVGTGFHPELTGRENIFLNGMILGMRRAEIRAGFDEIVGFAGVERFLETPVKHYSSGMYVRLAFAVAAHLTPEILIVDEVLAVGDAEFQRKCLGRMRDVARGGRTVLFVSHNLWAVEDLCPRSLLLRDGRVERLGPSREVIAHYLSGLAVSGSSWDVALLRDRTGTGRARLTRIEILTDEGAPAEAIPFRRPFRLRLHYHAPVPLPNPTFGWALITEADERLFLCWTAETGPAIDAIAGTGFVECRVLDQSALPGTYRFEAWITDVVNVSMADQLRGLGPVEVRVGDWCEHDVAGLASRHRGRFYVSSSWSPPRQ